MNVDKKDISEAVGTEAGVMEGTEGMRYWQFKKEICADKGWQLRSIEPETYDVVDDKHEKIGIFKSGQGYFPSRQAVGDAEAPLDISHKDGGK